MKRGILIALLLSACCAAAQDVGGVTIFRLSDHRRGWKPIAYCDGQRIAAIQGGKYVTLNVSAGRHTFTSNNSKTGVDLDVKPGGQYFLRVIGTTGPFNENGAIEVADPAQARTQMDRMEPLKVNEVAGGVCRTPPAGR